jgi:nitrate/TMAO reductase-like tetraheme cytochrome c subunit
LEEEKDLMFDKTRSWIKENKEKAVGLVVLAFIALIGLSYVGLTSTSTPGFCKGLCHTMIPDVNAWEKSSHGRRGVDCVGCHFQEGVIGYMTAKVLSSVDIINTITGAMGHSIDFLEEETKMIQKVKRYRGMELTMLPQYLRYPDQYKEYPGMRTGTMISSQADEDGYWMIKPLRGAYLRENIGQNCYNCHSSRGSRGRVSAKDTADFIIRNQLLEFTGKVEKRRKGIIVPHAIHLDKGYDCLDCHAEIAHGPIDKMDENGVIMPSMEICFQCHNDKLAPRECAICHQLQLRMNLGTEGIGIPDTPNTMYPDSTVCADCHLPEYDYKINAKKICVEECHEEGYDDTLVEWQDQTLALLKKMEPQVRAVSNDIEAAKRAGRNVGPAEELFNDANYNFRFVKDDGSKGGHNADYAESLLGVAQEKIEMAKDLLGQ